MAHEELAAVARCFPARPSSQRHADLIPTEPHFGDLQTLLAGAKARPAIRPYPANTCSHHLLHSSSGCLHPKKKTSGPVECPAEKASLWKVLGANHWFSQGL